MGKKSLLAPTSDEKASSGKSPEKEKKPLAASGTAKKAAPKSPKKKTAKASATKKKAAGSKTAKKKAAPKKAVSRKKTAPPRKTAVPKTSAKPKAKKAVAAKKVAAPKKAVAAKKRPAAAKKKPAAVSIKALLKKKFDMPVSGKKHSPPPVRQGGSEISSPPFFVGTSKEETDRVRRLLFKKFDSAAGEVPEGAESGLKPAAVKPETPEAKTMPRAAGPEESPKAAAAFSATGMGDILPEKKAMDPMHKMAAVGLCVFVVLLAMVLWSSASNVEKFYVKPVDGRLEVWKGNFSPKGADRVITLGNASMPAELKAVYSKEEAYTVIFEGVIADADALLNTEEMPDFDLIRRTLESAGPFAISAGMSERLQKRLDKIDMMALVYKADILSGKGTRKDLARARESLEKAMRLNLDEAEKGLIRQKIIWVDQKLAESAEQSILESGSGK